MSSANAQRSTQRCGGVWPQGAHRDNITDALEIAIPAGQVCSPVCPAYKCPVMSELPLQLLGKSRFAQLRRTAASTYKKPHGRFLGRAQCEREEAFLSQLGVTAAKPQL